MCPTHVIVSHDFLNLTTLTLVMGGHKSLLPWKQWPLFAQHFPGIYKLVQSPGPGVSSVSWVVRVHIFMMRSLP